MNEARHDPIPQSRYQVQLDEELTEDPSKRLYLPKPEDTVGPIIQSDDVNYWSDYNRVYYVPRSIHKLPDTAAFDNSGEDWKTGVQLFQRYDHVCST